MSISGQAIASAALSSIFVILVWEITGAAMNRRHEAAADFRAKKLKAQRTEEAAPKWPENNVGARYRWLFGPILTMPSPITHFSVTAMEMMDTGEQSRIFYGQIEDVKTGRRVNWAKEAPLDQITADKMLEDLKTLVGRSPDWKDTWDPDIKGSPRGMPGNSLAPANAPFEDGFLLAY